MSKEFIEGVNILNPVPCRFCRQTVSRFAAYCPHCGHPLSLPRRVWKCSRSILEVVAFLATAGAIWFTSLQLREMHEENKLRMVERKPYVQPTAVNFSKDSNGTVIYVNLLNSGLSGASNVVVTYRMLSDSSGAGIDSIPRNLTLMGMPARNWYVDRVKLTGADAKFTLLVLSFKAKWRWDEFDQVDSSMYEFLLNDSPGVSKGEISGLSVEQATRYWDHLRRRKQ